MSSTPNAQLRLCKHADYQRVYKSTRKQHAKQMAFFFSVRPPDRRSATPGARVGLTVGKVLGKAVERNRIKRRLRECVRRHIGMLQHAPVDVVLHPRRTALTMLAAELDREVASVFRTISVQLRKVAPPAAAPVAIAPAAVAPTSTGEMS